MRPRLDVSAPDAAQKRQAVNDAVMGGISTGGFRISGDETVEFSGTLSLDYDGGFASVRKRPSAFDIEKKDTVVVSVKENGHDSTLNICPRSRRMAFSYRAPLPTTRDEWTEVVLQLEGFIPTALERIRVAWSDALKNHMG